METTPIKILGVPIDLGGNHRGVDMGPSALRVAGLVERLRALGHPVTDLGNVHVPNPQSRDPGDPKAHFLAEIAAACNEVASTVAREYPPEGGMVILGGDHSAAMGSVAGVSAVFGLKGESIGVIWVDAHTDMNTPETSPSGNVHGMPAAALLGLGPVDLTGIGGSGPKVKPENMVFVGIRSVDAGERELVRRLGVKVYTMRDVDEQGIRVIMEEAVKRSCAGTAGFHLSFDMDGVDASAAPGVGTPVAGGLTYREAHHLAELACDSSKLLAMDVMEVNPIADMRNKTAILAMELVCSAYGQRIV